MGSPPGGAGSESVTVTGTGSKPLLLSMTVGERVERVTVLSFNVIPNSPDSTPRGVALALTARTLK